MYKQLHENFISKQLGISMTTHVKKAYEPGFIEGALSDVSQYLQGDPDFREAYSHPELKEIFKIDPEGKERGVYLDFAGLLKHLGDKRKSEFKITPEEKKDINLAKKYIQYLDMPSIKTIYSDASDQILTKPIRYFELYRMRSPDTANVYGLYYIGKDYIKTSRIIQENFKQSLGIATLVKQIGDKKINIPKERESAVKRILYGAYLSSGFIPNLDIDQFYNKIQTDEDFRSRYIKAMFYPAYSVAMHEGIHKKTIDPEDIFSRYGRALLYRNVKSPIFALSLAHAAGEIERHHISSIFNTLWYVYNTAEIDTHLSLLKRWYQIQTGKKISTIKEAKEAMEYIYSMVQKNNKLLGIVPIDVSNQYFAYSLNKRMIEIMETHIPKQQLEKGTDAFAKAYRDIRNAMTTYLYRLAQL